MKNKIIISAQVGETFKIGNYEFIRFPENNGAVPVVFKDSLFTSSYGKNNDIVTSKIMARLSEILVEIEELIGIDNVVEFDTDLTSVNGSKKNGVVRGKINQPSFDFYRENRAIFEKYKLDEYWWLSTPWETSEYTDDYWIACVSPRGFVAAIATATATVFARFYTLPLLSLTLW